MRKASGWRVAQHEGPDAVKRMLVWERQPGQQCSVGS